MFFKDLCVLVLRTNVASALEGLKAYEKSLGKSIYSSSLFRRLV